jgi:hypothetical protein
LILGPCITSVRQRCVLQEFAEQVVESEIRILLSHTLRKAGVDFDDDDDAIVFPNDKSSELSKPEEASNTATAPPPHENVVIDTDAALSAVRKVSSAHLDVFCSSGSITLYRVAGEDALSASTTLSVGASRAVIRRDVTKQNSTLSTVNAFSNVNDWI